MAFQLLAQDTRPTVVNGDVWLQSMLELKKIFNALNDVLKEVRIKSLKIF